MGEAHALACWKHAISACPENTQNRCRLNHHDSCPDDRCRARFRGLPKPELPKPESPWTKPTKVEAPATPTGSVRAPKSQPEAKPSTEVSAWRAAQKTRSTGGKGTADSLRAAAAADYLPEGQGEKPWHRILDTRLNDALVARVNISNGNLMLAATDFDIAGVGQRLQLTRTYNSLEAPWGKISQRWWQGYERYLQANDGEVDVFDATGNLLRFTANADGTYTTPVGYSKDLKQNADGTYTLSDRKSGTKDTYDEHGTLLKVTDKNDGTVTVDQHDEGAEHKGFKLTETRSGRWIDLVKTDTSQWQAKDHTGRTAVLDLDGAGNLTKVTDTALQGHHLRLRLLTPPDEGDHPRGHRHPLHLRQPQPRHLHATRHRRVGQRPHRPDLALRLQCGHPVGCGYDDGHRPRRRRHPVRPQR